MTEYLRKDTGLPSEPAILADPNSTETNTERTFGRDSDPPR